MCVCEALVVENMFVLMWMSSTLLPLGSSTQSSWLPLRASTEICTRSWCRKVKLATARICWLIRLLSMSCKACKTVDLSVPPVQGLLMQFSMCIRLGPGSLQTIQVWKDFKANTINVVFATLHCSIALLPHHYES